MMVSVTETCSETMYNGAVLNQIVFLFIYKWYR